MSNFSERLLEERKRLGYTQDKFSEIGGVSKGALCNYEGSGSADRVPDANFLAAINKAGADLLYIMTGIRTPGITEPHPEYVLVTPKQRALLDNLNHCPEEVQDAISKLALAAKKDDTDVVAKKKKSA